MITVTCPCHKPCEPTSPGCLLNKPGEVGNTPEPWGGLSSINHDFSNMLAQSARWHARTAVSNFVSDDPDARLQAACSAGTAVELLAKAYLADMNPALLADKGDKDTVLHLVGHGALAKGDVLSIKTIGAYEALRLVAQLHRGFPAFDQHPLC